MPSSRRRRRSRSSSSGSNSSRSVSPEQQPRRRRSPTPTPRSNSRSKRTNKRRKRRRQRSADSSSEGEDQPGNKYVYPIHPNFFICPRYLQNSWPRTRRSFRLCLRPPCPYVDVALEHFPLRHDAQPCASLVGAKSFVRMWLVRYCQRTDQTQQREAAPSMLRYLHNHFPRRVRCSGEADRRPSSGYVDESSV